MPSKALKDQARERADAELAEVTGRVQSLAQSISALIAESQSLRLKASEQREKAGVQLDSDSVDERLLTVAHDTVIAAEKKRDEWHAVMAAMMEDLQRLEISLLQFGAQGEAVRQELKQLAFRVSPNASLSFGPTAHVPDESRVQAGLERLQLLLAVMPGTIAPVETTLVESPKGYEGLGQKKRDFSRYFDGTPLTDRQHDCLSMKLEYGLSHRQIAARLRIHPSVVQDHIRRATVKLDVARVRGRFPKSSD